MICQSNQESWRFPQSRPAVIVVTYALLSTLVVWHSATPVFAQGCTPIYQQNLPQWAVRGKPPMPGTQNSSLEYLGSWRWGVCRGAAIMGDYVLTASEATVLWIDVTAKEHPVVVWDSVVGLAEAVIQDSIGYILSGSGLIVIDLHNPKCPSIVGELSLPYPWSLAIEGPFVFVKQFYGRVTCIDVSNPRLPYLRSSVLSSSAYGPLTVHKNNLYIGDVVGFPSEYVDVSNPDSMVIIQVNLPPFMGAMCSRDSLLFIGSGSALSIYSTTTPASPLLLSSTVLCKSWVSAVTIRGDTAFVGTGHGEVVTVDISDSRQPEVLATHSPSPPSPLPLYNLVAKDTVLYGTYASHLVVFSVADPNSPTALSSVPTGHESNKVVIWNGPAYVTSGMGGLWIVDMSDPSRPRRKGNLQTASYAHDLVVDSTIAYVSFNFPYCEFNHGEGRTGIWAIDVSRPDSLRVLDSCILRFPYAIAKSHSLLFVTHADHRINCGDMNDTTMTILDVADPSHMRVVGHAVGGYNVCEIAARDSIAFIATRDSGMRIYDCRDPVHPRLLSTTLRYTCGVSLSGQYAYVNAFAGTFPRFMDSLFVFDVTDLTSPVIVGRALHRRGDYGTGWESVVQDGFLFWAGGGRFGAFDVSDPRHPRALFADSIIPWWGGSIQARGDTIFVTEQGSGLWVFRYDSGAVGVARECNQVASTIQLLPNYPNPFNASTQLRFVTAIRGHVRIEVFDLLGQRISTLFEGIAEAGEHTVEFDGSGLPSGVYFYKLFFDNLSITSKMTLLR